MKQFKSAPGISSAITTSHTPNAFSGVFSMTCTRHSGVMPLTLFIILNILISTAATATELPTEERAPGGVVIIDLGTITDQPPQAFFSERPVMVIQNETHWSALIGLPLSQPVGTASLKVIADKKTRVIPFSVDAKVFPTQKLNVAPNYVNPPADVEKRIEAEAAELNALFAHVGPAPSTFIFQKPALGPWTSNFGLRREFNGEARNPHSGLDIAAERGSDVLAGGSGVVVLAKALYFNGNTVIIDHGGGLLTMYCHLDRIDAKPGSNIIAGSKLGIVGATGRVTGPHLHWSVSLTGARVNPALFIHE